MWPSRALSLAYSGLPCPHAALLPLPLITASVAALEEHTNSLCAMFSSARSFSSSPIETVDGFLWPFGPTLQFLVCYNQAPSPCLVMSQHMMDEPSACLEVQQEQRRKYRQQIHFSKLAATAGSVVAALLNAIILTVRYGIVPKWHLYLSQFIILFQPCKAVLQIHQVRHKIYSPTFFEDDDNGPRPFALLLPSNDYILLAHQNISLILGE